MALVGTHGTSSCCGTELIGSLRQQSHGTALAEAVDGRGLDGEEEAVSALVGAGFLKGGGLPGGLFAVAVGEGAFPFAGGFRQGGGEGLVRDGGIGHGVGWADVQALVHGGVEQSFEEA